MDFLFLFLVGRLLKTWLSTPKNKKMPCDDDVTNEIHSLFFV